MSLTAVDRPRPPATARGRRAARAPWAWIGLVLVCGTAGVTGALLGTAVAVLLLAGATMLLAIFAFWHSLRALLGDSPLPPEDAYSLGAVAAEDEQKRAVLRALDDLETERRLGRVDEADYAELGRRYRAEAGAMLGAEPEAAAELRGRIEERIAERLAQAEPKGDGAEEDEDRTRSDKRPQAATADDDAADDDAADDDAADDDAADDDAAGEDAPESDDPARKRTKRDTGSAEPRSCESCSTQNDPDARFCKRCGRALSVLLALVLVLLAPGVRGQPAASAAPSAGPDPSARSTASPRPSVEAGPASGADAASPAPAANPASAPRLSPSQMGAQLPPGHPDISQMKQGQMTQGGQGRAGMPGSVRPPRPRAVLEDPSLEAGTMDIVVLDANDELVPGVRLVLSTLRASGHGEVPKTDRTEAQTDEQGRHRFTGLAVGRSASYFLSAERGRAQFPIDPFDLPADHGVRVRIRALEATSDPAATRLDVWVMVALEVQESSLAVDHLIRVNNAGPKAWVPEGLRLALPSDAGEVEAPEAMSAAFVRSVDGSVELGGTYTVGTTDLQYRYRVPLAGSAEQTLAVGLPPAASWVRVVTPATANFGLQVPGLGAVKSGRSPEGQQLLVAEQRREDGAEPSTPAPARMLHVTITGLPAPGAARWVALVAGLLALLWGAAMAWNRRAGRGPNRDELVEAQDVLLDEVTELERQHRAGSLNRAAYEATRDGLVDALVRIEQRLEADSR